MERLPPDAFDFYETVSSVIVVIILNNIVNRCFRIERSTYDCFEFQLYIF